MDYTTIESGTNSDKDVNVLVVTDHFTRYAQAFITPSQAAKVVHTCVTNTLCTGLPEKILSDQGRNLNSNLVKELCELSGIKKLRTTPYRPQNQWPV